MKRGLLLTLGVLFLFLILVAIGFWSLGEPSQGLLLEREELTSHAPELPRVPLSPAPLPHLGEQKIAAGEVQSLRPELTGLKRLVDACFSDAKERLRGPQRVSVTFNTTDAGRFADVVITESTWPDPQVEACILDSFDDAWFEPNGQPSSRQVHTFTF